MWRLAILHLGRPLIFELLLLALVRHLPADVGPAHTSDEADHCGQNRLEFPRFRGHLTGGPSGLPERMSVDAKDAAVFEGVPR